MVSFRSITRYGFFQQRYIDLLQKISLLSIEQQLELEEKFKELKEGDQ